MLGARAVDQRHPQLRLGWGQLLRHLWQRDLEQAAFGSPVGLWLRVATLHHQPQAQRGSPRPKELLQLVAYALAADFAQGGEGSGKSGAGVGVDCKLQLRGKAHGAHHA